MPALVPLEFVDCVIDSPQFRDNLAEHEREIEYASKGLKAMTEMFSKYIEAIRQLKQAQFDLATCLKECSFSQNSRYSFPDSTAATDDEIRIQNSFDIFHEILVQNGEAIDKMANCFVDCILEPLKKFRHDRLQKAKEDKKKFERLTAKYCQSLEKYLSTKTKVNDTVISEADHNIDKEKQAFLESSMQHVVLVQDVKEENRLKIVETLIIMNKLLSAFHYEAQEAFTNEMDNIESIKCAVQMAQDRFEHVQTSAKELMNKTLKKAPESIVSQTYGFFARQGYLYILTKKAVSNVWVKHFCQYNKEVKQLQTTPYIQTDGALKNHHSTQQRYKLMSCVRRATDSIDRRFCFEITVEDRNSSITLQAMSEEDMRLWLDVMDGKEPTYAIPSINKSHTKTEVEETTLNEEGYYFLDLCIKEIERRGLDEEGLYRVSGSQNKLSRFIQYAQVNRKRRHKSNERALVQLKLDNYDEYDTRLLTSAVKKYLRLLTEPLMTFELHDSFIAAAKQKDPESRIATVGKLTSELPTENRRVLTLLIHHFRNIAANSSMNKMTPANLGIVIGPSIFRPVEESVASIMDIKFAGVVVQIMVENCNRFFPDPPSPPSLPTIPRTSSMRGLRSHSVDSPAVDGGQGQTHITVPGSGAGSGLGNLKRQLSSKLRRSIRYSGSFRNPASSTLTPQPAATPTSSGDGASPGVGGVGGGATGTAAVAAAVGNSTANLQPPLPPSRQPSHSPVMERHSMPIPAARKTGKQVRLSQPISRADLKSHPNSSTVNGNGRSVRTKYPCVGEQDNELSFEVNRIILNVRPSEEEGWLWGVLDGREGLIPENYVEFL